MTSVSCSLTSYLKQYGNQLFLSTMRHNLLLFWCHDVMLLFLCSLVQIKLTLILKATELVEFVPIVISENFAIFCVTLVVLLTLCRLCMYHLLITFANSLDPDQAWQNVRPDLDPNYLKLWWYSWNNFSKKLILKKISRRQKSMQNYPACKELTTLFHSDGFCHTYWYKKYEIVDFVS